MLNLLFVYGTLRLAENPISQELNPVSKRLGTAHVCGKLFDLGSYPGIILSHDLKDKVWGEVLALACPKKSLTLIDQYEGVFPDPESEYRRQVTDVIFERERTPCWIYVYQQAVAGLSPIHSGDYLHYLSHT